MLARFFIDRPVFATVLSLVIVLVGAVSLATLPVAQYPEVTPPTISVTANYPGASARVVADTVATPIEQEVNGVEKMLYMSSRSTNDGQMTLDITFELGTDINQSQVLVQNRVAIAEARLPEEVTRQGVSTKKKSSTILLCVNLISPNKKYDQLYLSNYATIQIKDALARLPGVGDVTFIGARDYSMRAWLDPDELASRNLTASDVVAALREQNVQVAAGRLAQPPVPEPRDFTLAINTLGRLLEPEQFGQVIIRTGTAGQVVHLADVARIELGARNYEVGSYLDGSPAMTLAVFQLPGSNALATADLVRAEMRRLANRFPEGIEYRIVYDTTVFIDESVHEVYKTLFEAFVLVFLVVLLFLQDWRATLLPMIDVPVSLIGTFAIMALLGFSLNNLSLFGLVLAIGIVVDDAIVVVENIERWAEQGLPIREATIRAMDEITGPVLAITLVLSSVFIPTAFLSGLSGQFYRQFALTIATATIISAINALTMAPARAVQLIRPHTEHGHADREALPRGGVALLIGLLALWLASGWLPAAAHDVPGQPAASPYSQMLARWGAAAAILIAGGVVGWLAGPAINRFLAWGFGLFNQAFNWITEIYGSIVARLLRLSALVLLVYVGMLAATWFGFSELPAGFIPEQDKGYLVVNSLLPDGASLSRTEELVARLTKKIQDTAGVAHVLAFPGYNVLNSSNLSNAAGMFVILEPFEERKHDPTRSANAIIQKLRQAFYTVEEAQIVAFGAPPVEGLGSTGGFKLQLEDRGDAGLDTLAGGLARMLEQGAAQPGIVGLFSSFRATQPQLFVDIDRTKAKTMGVSLAEINSTLQVYLGSAYVNDFTRFGRNWQVNVQADAQFRLDRQQIGQLKVRSAAGAMIPLATLISVRDVSGPAIWTRYNMYPSAEIVGAPAPGTSSAQAMSVMEQLADNELPQSMSYEWTEIALLQQLAGNTAIYMFALGTVFVFLVLSALYESWSMPLAIILIVPLCALAAVIGVWLTGGDNNLFTQIGLTVLVGLAAKNAILIVEFARQRQDAGIDATAAAIEASKTRLRPIVMTSLAFILGVAPLVVARGAGAEMRTALGIAVFSGMLGVTLFGLVFTPVFYRAIEGVLQRRQASPHPVAKSESP